MVEDRVQNVGQVLTKMIKVMNQQENKLLDQKGRARQENIRIYNVPEGAEGSSMLDCEKVTTGYARTSPHCGAPCSP